MLATHDINEDVKCSSFQANETQELYFSITSESNVSFKKSLENIYENYVLALQECQLSEETQIFTRYYLSDIANQKNELEKSKIFNLTKNGSFSVIQQCPLEKGNLILFSYHIKKNEPLEKQIFRFDDGHWRNAIKVKSGNYELFWTGNFSGYGPCDSFEQTNEIFSSYNRFLNGNSMTLLNNTIRTWIYVRDIDNHYHGMGKSRKIYFEGQGLTENTRYIASTGIEAKLKEIDSLVSMDSIAISNLCKSQIIRMEALEYLCPTHLYGITFERGTKIEFGDRSHLYISGTASIDRNGNVLHISDIKKQTLRTLENIKALLEPHNASLDDMVYLIVYVRNITEVDKVKEVLGKNIKKKIPIIIVEGSVCRPSWLVEMEGVGIIPSSTSFPNF
jgi:enamine deaminase RidA (YjgF/YER057c/UK114 family)